MIPPDVANGLALYWVIGVLWLSSGFLPKPFGWLRHDMPLVVQIFFVVFFGAVWPTVLAKIVYEVVWRNNGEIEL
jgi:hypothetical protein